MNLNVKPLQIEHLKTRKDKIIEAFSWFALLLNWLLVLIYFNELPEEVPVHFDASGKADSFGDKDEIMTLPLISTVTFLGLSFLNRFPQIYNYPVKITEENKIRQYSLATRMIRYLNFVIVLLFAFITFQSVRVALSQTESLGWWFLPISILAVFFPLVYYIVKMTNKSH